MTKQNLKILLLSFFIGTHCTLYAQKELEIRPLSELIDKEDLGWQRLNQLIKVAKNKLEILPSDSVTGAVTLYEVQVTTKSPMGAIIYHTGGILVDHGWVRILGSGSKKLSRNISTWNRGKSYNKIGDRPGFYFVADDVLGGYFAINGGQLGKDLGNIYYFSPDALKWQPMEISYTSFLEFCFSGDLKKFYKNMRWKNWISDTEEITGDQVFSIFPPLWSKEGAKIEKCIRTLKDIDSQYEETIKLLDQMAVGEN